METDQLFKEFGDRFKYEHSILECNRIGPNTIFIRLATYEELVFTYNNHHDWCIETKESYIKAKLRENDCYI